MAQYQVGSSVYEVPDNVSGQQLNAILTQLASQETASQPQQERDGALAYSVDRAQQLLGKGVEVAGDLAQSPALKAYGQSVVAQQEKDIEAGGYKPTYTGTLRETYKQGGIKDALGWVAEKSMENAASGGLAIAGTGAAAITAPFSAPAAALIGGGTLVASGVMGAGESAMEQEEKTGDYDSRVAAGTGAIVGILDKFGASKVIPSSALSKMSGEEIIEALIKSGNPNAATAIGGRILRSTGVEAATETTQEAAIAASAASQGGQYTQDELIDRGLEAAVLGGTMGGTTTTAIEGAKATGRGVKNVTGFATEEVTPEIEAARSASANRLSRIAQGNGFNLKNVGKMGSKGAVDAVDNAHTEIVSEIDLALEGLSRDPQSTLKPQKTDSEELAAKKAKARLGLKNARNKVKGVTTNDQIQAIEELVGGTTEGQQLINLALESNELTALHKAGYVGGVSQYTDLLSPLGSNAGYDRGAAATERLLRPLLTGGAAFQTGGSSLAIQGGLAAGGRLVDFMTGRRSRVAKFIRDNQNKTGQSVTATASARSKALAAYKAKQAEIARKKAEAAEQARQRQLAKDEEEARKRAAAKAQRKENEAMFNDGTRQTAEYAPTSPQQTLLLGTGMDLKNVLIVLEELAKSDDYSASAKAALKSLKSGGAIEVDGRPALSNLIRIINAAVDTGRSSAQVVRPNGRDLGAFERYKNGQAENANIQRGIEANKAAAQALIDAVDADQTLDPVTKGIIKGKLNIFQKDVLSADPLSRAQQELQEAVTAIQANNGNIEAAQQYLGQYIKRIETQQRARQQQHQNQQQNQQQNQTQNQQQNQTQSSDDPLRPLDRPNSFLHSKSRQQLNKELTEELAEAAKDLRYNQQGQYRYSSKDNVVGKANFVAKYDDATVSFIAQVKPELDELCDRFNVPRIRGMVPYAYGGGARMGDGVMYFNARTFNNLTKQIGADKVGWETTTWKWGDSFKDVPKSTYYFFDNKNDAARAIMYHELGHHIHQQFASKDGGVTDFPLEEYAKTKAKKAPTKYAGKNVQEWFAENFEMYWMDRKEVVDPDFIEMIEYVLLNKGVPS